MENTSSELSPGIVLLPPSPLVSNSRCRRALLYALAEQPIFQQTSLPNKFDATRSRIYNSFLASKIFTELSVWDLDDRQSLDWLSATFPSRIIAVVLPVIHPKSWYHKIMSEYQLPLTENVNQHVEKLLEEQKRYLKNRIIPIKVYSKLPIIHVYIQEFEETNALERLIGQDFLSVTQNFICPIEDTDTFTHDLKNYLKPLFTNIV